MKKITIISFLFLTAFIFAQNKALLENVKKNTNIAALNVLKLKFDKEDKLRQARVETYLKSNSKLQKKATDGFSIKEIYDVVDNVVHYAQTSNYNSAITSRANKLYSAGGLGLNIQGQGMTAYVWDGGSARTSHEEFPNSKVTSGDGAVAVNHATHVMGTIVAKGLDLRLRGVAFDASAISYDWTNDYSEMTAALLNGMLVSNHSYWIGVASREWTYGSYDSRARDFDQIAFEAPFYLAVTAAGNDRNDFTDPVLGPYLNLKGGYNLTRGMQNAKNFLTIGAVNEVTNYTNSSSVTMSTFSSWGPTDDGRIKPDIVTKGTAVRSTTSATDTSSGNNQGTSMASPNITGTALLLQQYYSTLNNNYMRAATLKGIILHTADEAGSSTGPDYQFGWGLINAEKAADVITQKGIMKSIIDENTINDQQTFQKVIYSDGLQPLTASLSWTDRPSTANSSIIDPINLNLINDLDIRIIRNTAVYFPWTLDPANPWSDATRDADNFRDNFEKISIDTPDAGMYTISITHKNTLVGGAQNYSLIVSGVNQTLSNNNFQKSDESVTIFPNPFSDTVNFSFATDFNCSKITVYNILGNEILSDSKFENRSIDLSFAQSGVYFVKFFAENQVYTRKIIKN